MPEKNPCFVISKCSYDAVIFDLDGVITKTATVHAAAWKKLFDWYLEKRQGEEFKPFDPDGDYRRYVDGEPRYKGVQSFLESRGIKLPYGSPDDDPDQETVCGLGNKKNTFFHEEIRKQGVEVFKDGVDLLHRLRVGGFQTAIKKPPPSPNYRSSTMSRWKKSWGTKRSPDCDTGEKRPMK